jgi:hypothetical protein
VHLLLQCGSTCSPPWVKVSRHAVRPDRRPDGIRDRGHRENASHASCSMRLRDSRRPRGSTLTTRRSLRLRWMAGDPGSTRPALFVLLIGSRDNETKAYLPIQPPGWEESPHVSIATESTVSPSARSVLKQSRNASDLSESRGDHCAQRQRLAPQPRVTSHRPNPMSNWPSVQAGGDDRGLHRDAPDLPWS